MTSFSFSYVLLLVDVVKIALTSTCKSTQGIFHHGKKYYSGTVLKRVVNTGPQMCLRTCQNTSGCSHINFNTCELKCDLMRGNTEHEEANFIPSEDMTFGTLMEYIQVMIM